MPRSTFLPREGLYIDPIASFMKQSLFNPWVAGTFSVLLHCARGKNIGGDIIQGLSGSQPLRLTSATLAIIGLLLHGNDFFSRQTHNNWTKANEWEWDKEIVLITGGSGGIGASVAKELIVRNPRTTIVIIDYSPLRFDVPANSRVLYYQCDLSISRAVKEVCARVRKEVGDPTVVFNNAGLTRGATVMEGTYADVDITFRTNVIAPFLVLKEFLPAMVRRNHGHIVATSSMSSIITPAGLADYAATKAGLNALHRALAQELKFKHNAPKVRLSLITLSFTATPMFKGKMNQSHFVTPLMHVDTVGEKVVDTLYSQYGCDLYFPGIMRYIACMQGCPEWLARSLADSTHKLEVDYVGRQQLDSETGALG